MKTIVVFLLLIVIGNPSHAASWLSEVQFQSRDDGIGEVQIVFGEELELLTEFIRHSPTEFKARAKASQHKSEGWQFVELQFEDERDQLKKVSVEGSAQQGFEVSISFHRPFTVQTLPQYSTFRTSVLITDEKLYRKLSKFARKAPPGNPQQFAISFTRSGGFRADSIPHDLASAKNVYAYPTSTKQLRVGSFSTESAAKPALRALRGTYPDAAIVGVSDDEVAYAEALNLYSSAVLASYRAQPERNIGVSPGPGSLSIEPLATVTLVTPKTIATPQPRPAPVAVEWKALDRGILDEAQDAFIEKDYSTAIALYTKATDDAGLREEALEMLGVSRQRNGQIAHAKAEYQRFLDEYPESAANQRVAQRLRSLIGSDLTNPALHQADRQSRNDWDIAGNLSQFYQRYSLDVNGTQTSVPIDALFTDANLIVRKQGNNTHHEARLAVGHMLDFSADKDTAFRFNQISWESVFDGPGIGIKMGRQSRNDAGILGRFDGAVLSWRQSDRIRWNLVGGFAVQSSFDAPSTERPVYGIHTQLEFFDGNLELSPFLIEQKRNGVLDRRAIGVHSMYFTDRATYSSLIDYDIYHQALNNFIVNANYNLSRKWRLSGSYDFRRSPYLTTSNALIGQRYQDLSELEQSLLDLKLGDLAEDRTATGNMLRLGLFGRLNNTWSVSLDGSVSKFSSTETSLGVLGMEARTDYYLSTQIRADDLFSRNTYSSIQVRFMGSDRSNTSTINFVNRVGWANWYLFPRLMFSQRNYTTSDQQQLQIRPSLRLDYRGFKRFRLEMELGYDWTKRDTAFIDTEIKGMYVRMGYRTLF